MVNAGSPHGGAHELPGLPYVAGWLAGHADPQAVRLGELVVVVRRMVSHCTGPVTSSPAASGRVEGGQERASASKFIRLAKTLERPTPWLGVPPRMAWLTSCRRRRSGCSCGSRCRRAVPISTTLLAPVALSTLSTSAFKGHVLGGGAASGLFLCCRRHAPAVGG